MRRDSFTFIAACILLCASAHSQDSSEFKNLQVLNKAISERELTKIMKQFTVDLGVRCEFCHVELPNNQGDDFVSDSNSHKEITRGMMRMVNTINGVALPQAVGLPPDRLVGAVNCMTCHRGSANPVFIEDRLAVALQAGGADSAIALYKSLRNRWYGRAKYDFGEQVISRYVEQLFDTDTASAFALQQMNIEFYPTSASALLTLAYMYEGKGDRIMAITIVDSALAIDPKHRGALGLKEELQAAGMEKK